MKNNLTLIIKKKEKYRIEQEIKDCLELKFYEEAEFLKWHLYKIQQQLEKFYHLKNPNIHEIQRKVGEIKGWQKSAKHFQRLHPNIKPDFLQKEIAQSKKELAELKSKNPPYGLDETLIYDLLEDLILKKVKRFKFSLITQSKVELSLRLLKADLIIDLSGIKLPKNTDSYEYNQIIQLRKIGFDFHGIKVERVINDFDQQKILAVIEILARVIYDAFYVGELDDPINLIIEE